MSDVERIAEPSVILEVIAGPYQGQRFTLEGATSFRGGRDKSAAIALPKDETCSSKHFVIEVELPECRVVDAKSKNGTFLVDVDKSGAISTRKRVETSPLRNGDHFMAGKNVFRVTLGWDPTSTVPYQADADPGEAFPTIPRHRIVRVLGQGGMGIVYQAERLSDGTMVAVKTIKIDSSVSDKDIKAFHREVRNARSLNHPRIVGFYEADLAGEVVFYTMEYVPGVNGSDYVRERGPLPVGRAVRLACMVMEGLEYAHAQGFVHRDVKPNNLLIWEEAGRELVKVADFGLSKAYLKTSLSGITLEGQVRGAPLFMPPEQITDYRSVKPSGDQYGVAATLYFLLTARALFDFKPKSHDVYRELLHTRPVPLRERRPEVPEALGAAIDRALARAPDDRFATMADFRQAIVRFSD